jgi:hypothetical protein
MLMSVLDRIAFYQGRRDEIPNQTLARALVKTGDRAGIAEIAANLHHANRNVQSDCVKVLYEVGYLDPALIADHVNEFLNLLGSKNNRLVWGGMLALSSISSLRPRQVWARIDEVITATRKGTVITAMAGVKTLAGVAASNARYRSKLIPVLLEQLRTCPPRDLPVQAESILRAVSPSDRPPFLDRIEARKHELTTAQASRLRRMLRKLEANSPP